VKDRKFVLYTKLERKHQQKRAVQVELAGQTRRVSYQCIKQHRDRSLRYVHVHNGDANIAIAHLAPVFDVFGRKDPHASTWDGRRSHVHAAFTATSAPVAVVVSPIRRKGRVRRR
jgi:hypothetical protein